VLKLIISDFEISQLVECPVFSEFRSSRNRLWNNYW